MNTKLVKLLSHLKNCLLAKKKIMVHNTKVGFGLLNILWDEGFISGYTLKKHGLKIFLKYKNEKPVITSLKLITKPGHRMSYKLNQLWKLTDSNALIIMSTSRGFLSLKECKKYKVGGQPLVILR